MSDDKKCCNESISEKSSKCCGGAKSKSKCIIILLILIIVGVGAFAYIKDKANGKNKDVSEKTSSVESSEKAEMDILVDDNVVLAIIDGDEIKRSEVIEIVNTMPAQMTQIPMEQLFPMALEQLVNNKIIDKNAAKAGLETNKDVLEKLEQAKEQIIRATFLENAIKEKVTDEAIKAKYDEYVKNFPDVEEVKAAHILVDDEKLAKSIIKKLNSGADFVDLAKENSKDGSSENGGELGYFTKVDVVPAFAEAAFATKVGEYTKTPVKSAFGYHIIKIEDKRKRPPAEFEQIKPYIEQEMHRAALDEVLKELKSEANIERFDINGNPLPVEDAVSEDTSIEEEADAASDAEKEESPKAE